MKINLNNHLSKIFKKPKHDFLSAVESFDQNLPNERFFSNVYINFNFPFTELKFKFEDSLTALGISIILVSGGFSSENDFNIYINRTQISKKFDTYQFDNFLNLAIPYLEKDENTITLECLNFENFDYFYSSIFFWRDSENDISKMTEALENKNKKD